MPWTEASAMSRRLEFVTLAAHDGANVRALCRRFGVHPSTAYKWVARHAAGGEAALADRPRRPLASPGRTPPAVEAEVVAVRREHPAWGGRKIRADLLARGRVAAADLPAASTVAAVLRRHGLVGPAASAAAAPHARFEHPAPNDLWQVDFKGHLPLGGGGGGGGPRCHPLTATDDHSRFCLLLRACPDERDGTVRAHLTAAFRAYGLPARILCDNGPPWGGGGGRWTALSAWLLLLGVSVSHGRAYHPQTQGKAERFHRTLAAEAVGARAFGGLADARRRFDAWRDVYNLRRPHEALGLAVPAARYRPSRRAFPEREPEPQYGPGDQVRRVQQGGVVSYRGRPHKVGGAFVGRPVALRPTTADGEVGVFFCHQQVATIDLRAHSGLA